jgi:hypothetical protein
MAVVYFMLSGVVVGAVVVPAAMTSIGDALTKFALLLVAAHAAWYLYHA